MGRGAPNKKGLSYFPKMIDFYEDDKVFDLLDRYGPLGVTVYDCILCIVYKQGSFTVFSKGIQYHVHKSCCTFPATRT